MACSLGCLAAAQAAAQISYSIVINTSKLEQNVLHFKDILSEFPRMKLF